VTRQLGFVLGSILVLLGCAAAQLLLPRSFTDLDSDQLRHFILLQLRLPRVLIALLVGATLAMVGGSFQILFRNPLATPSTVGTTAGATLGALLALSLRLEGALGVSAITSFAFLGAVLATVLVLSVASSARASIEEILLAGIAITLSAGAISQGLHLIADQTALFAAAQWSLGQLPQVGYERVLLLLGPVALCHLLVFSQQRALNVLGWGEERARSVGVSTRRVRLTVVLGGCLGVGATVALCGPIAFVGLLVPHLVRRFLGEQAGTNLLAISASGAVFLLASDTVAHFVVPHHELPVGVITASLGAPALFFLILRRAPRG
jgi:iron complex transport system permease protein